MGIYLSTPSTEIQTEEGIGNSVSFAVGEMQGWRKNMEDTHITVVDLDVSFIYDKDNNIVHENDDVDATDNFTTTTSSTTACKDFIDSRNLNKKISIFGVFDGHGGKEVSRFVKLKYVNTIKQQLRCGLSSHGDISIALKESFHNIDDQLEDLQNAELLKRLRAIPNPSDAVLRPQSTVEACKTSSHLSTDLLRQLSLYNSDNDAILNNTDKNNSNVCTKLPMNDIDDILDDITLPANSCKVPNKHNYSSNQQLVGENEQDLKHILDDIISKVPELSNSHTKHPTVVPSSSSSSSSSSSNTIDNVLKTSDNDLSNNGLLPTIINDVNTNTDDDDDDDIIDIENKISTHYDTTTTPTITQSENLSINSQKPGKLGRFSRVGFISPPASILCKDVLTCNLKNHRISAGCTAIVAIHEGNHLYVANAGDSRGVLYRKDGIAYALSIDHKPQLDIEMDRISKAGGFVNNVGRINGNLNLSRALGDLKYKQLYHLTREEQIITAEPDVSITELLPGDKFFILACDGIWDCLSNQEACDFVQSRLDLGLSITEITKQILNHCLSEDPRRTGGIGGDNMTFLIVLLNNDNNNVIKNVEFENKINTF